MFKVDFVLNIFFIITSIYFSSHENEIIISTLIDLFFFGVILLNAIYGIKSVENKDEAAYSRICLLRLFLELFKIMKVILILNGINSSFSYSEKMVTSLGKIRFSILVQEIISIGLLMPMMSLGRLIFIGFSIKRFDEIF